MSDTRKPQDDAPVPTDVFVALLAVAVASVMLIIGSVTDLGNVDANAAPVVSSAPDQSVTPEEHSAFIRESHARAAREADDSPLPPTF